MLKTIQDISNKPEFLTSHNNQSLVEICVTRVISAIRETGSIEQHADALISLLESCLSHSLRPSGRGDPPHAKMASDIMSCIFLNYSKRDVMIAAIPVAVKFLHKGNQDLSRNLSSYMSLAVIENADILSRYIQPVLDSVITGNFSLARVLPAIYAVDKQLINNHVMTLVSLLPNCSDSENTALLNLFGLVARDSTSLLEPSIPQLCECLGQQSTVAPTIQVLQDIAGLRPKCLVDHLPAFKQTAARFPKATVSVIQLMATVARSNIDKSRDTLDYVFDVVGGVELEKQNIVFKEVSLILQKFPSLLNSNLINRLSKFEDQTSSGAKGIIQDIRNEYNMQRIDRPQEKTEVGKMRDGVTIVRVGGSRPDVSRVKSSENIPVGKQLSVSGLKHAGSEVRVAGDGQPATERQLSVVTKDGSRSTGKLPTHRSMTSMTRLNMGTSARLDTRMTGLHKSMTRLDHHRYSSHNTVMTPVVINTRSNITNSSFRPGHHPPSLSTYTKVINTTGSPTKSMSSGSMSGLINQDLINQIHSDFARQSQNLSEHLGFSKPSVAGDFSRDSSLPPNTMSLSSTAPLSLPATASSKRQTYSSGPLTSQPPSLPAVETADRHQHPSISNSNSQPLDSLKTSYDRITAGHRDTAHGRSTFSNTLPSLRRHRSHAVTSVSTSDGGDLANDNPAASPGHSVNNKNRISVFEPFPMRDTVQHFCEKHLNKIKSYMESVNVKLPLPVKCTIEERKGRKHAKLHFACQGRGDHCLYKTTFYTMKSRHPKSWIHLMFLALQSRSQSALSTRDPGVSSLKNCWEILKCEEKSFSTLVTGAFPNARDQDSVIHELNAHRFFDVFEYNAPKLQWGCFLCNHPERASTFIESEEPVIEGQLKEKKGGKWRIFKKWKNRYFTLSGARLACQEGETSGGRVTQALDVGSIRSVKVSKHGRNIPKAFEIFTADKTFILKAEDSSSAQV